MKYYNGNGNLLQTVYVPAGGSIVNNLPTTMPYKEMENTPANLKYVYKHIGWAFSEGAEVPLEWTDAVIGRAQRDRNFYPVFVLDSVYNNVLGAEYLTATIEGNEAYLKVKPGYHLIGKITLPKTFDGKHVNGIAEASQAESDLKQNGFAFNTDLTAIF